MAVLSGVLLWSALSPAQSTPPTAHPLDDAFSASDVADGDSGALAPPEARRLDLELQWSGWRRSLTADRAPSFERLRDLRSTASALGRRNLPAHAGALASRADREWPRAETSRDRARTRRIYTEARRLAPDLPHPSLARAATVLWHTPTEITEVVGSYSRGLVRSLEWPYTRLTLELQLLWAALAGFAAAGSAFVLLQILRNLGVAAEDLARRLPSFVSRGQVVASLALLGLAAGLYMESLLAVLGIGFAAAATVQHTTERLVSLALFAVIGALPAIEGRISDLSTFPDGRSRQLFDAQYLGCDGDCRDDLRDRVRERTDSAPPADLAYTLALAEIRTGTDVGARRAEDLLGGGARGIDEMLGRVQNLRGAVEAIRGDWDGAAEYFGRAETELPDHPAPPFNLARALQASGASERATGALRRAIERSPGAVQRRLELDGSGPAAELMLTPLSPTHFRRAHRQRTEQPETAISAVWAGLAGPRFPFDRTPWLALAGALYILATWPLHWFRRTSTPCPDCGLARHPEDLGRTGGDYRCLPCYRTTVGGPGAGYRAEVREESRLKRRSTLRRILRRSLSAVVPGAGHLFAGHALRGIAITGVLFGSLWLLVGPPPVWRPPFALAAPGGVGLRTAAWIGGLAALSTGLLGAYRDLEPYRRD